MIRKKKLQSRARNIVEPAYEIRGELGSQAEVKNSKGLGRGGVHCSAAAGTHN